MIWQRGDIGGVRHVNRCFVLASLEFWITVAIGTIAAGFAGGALTVVMCHLHGISKWYERSMLCLRQ